MKRKVFGIGLIFVLLILFFYINNDEKKLSNVVYYNGNNLRISVDGMISDYLPNGNYYLATYDCKNSTTVLAWDRSTSQLHISNQGKSAGVSCYLNFETYPRLLDMEVGSYVSYVGDNNCPEGHCDGTNANYVSYTDMGYCNSSNYKFIVNGWRIAYINEGSVYLISAGAPECLCTNSNGTISNYSCDSSETTVGVPLHLKNLNARALTYCNKDYAYGGLCNESTARAMNATDFQKIMGRTLSSSSCYYSSNNFTCGYNNDLIDNGGYYWLATAYSTSSNGVFNWYPNYRIVNNYISSYLLGVRPVIRLDANVVVTSGTGTYEDPYTIGNNSFLINDGASTVSNANKSSISLTLMTVNATQMCISTNTSVCTDYIDYTDTYTLDWSDEEAGEKIVYVYYKDATGNIIAAINRSITLTA